MLKPEMLRTNIGGQRGPKGAGQQFGGKKLLKPECQPIIFKEKSGQKLVKLEILRINQAEGALWGLFLTKKYSKAGNIADYSGQLGLWDLLVRQIACKIRDLAQEVDKAGMFADNSSRIFGKKLINPELLPTYF